MTAAGIATEDTSFPSTLMNNLAKEYPGAVAPEVQCFSKGTKILLPDMSFINIEDVYPGLVVYAFDEGQNSAPGNVLESPLIPATVKRVFRNVTQEWFKLSCGLNVTPGHRFLNEMGLFETISSILMRGGKIVNTECIIIDVLGEKIIYSDINSHYYEEVGDLIRRNTGNTLFKYETEPGC